MSLDKFVVARGGSVGGELGTAVAAAARAIHGPARSGLLSPDLAGLRGVHSIALPRSGTVPG